MTPADHESLLRSLVRDHHASLARFVGHREFNGAEAEDVLSDVWAAAVQNLDWLRAQPDTTVGRWLFAVARKQVAMRARSAAARRRMMARLRAEPSSVFDGADPQGGGAEAAAGIRLAQVRTAMSCLRPSDREIIGLVAEGAPLTKVAEQLDIEVGTARVRLSRARSRLRRELARNPEVDRDA